MKNDLPEPLRQAEKAAQGITSRFGITQPEHIQLEDIAFALGVRVKIDRLDGATARLVRFGDSGVIRISRTERNVARIRFSTAHELGHFYLKHGHSLDRLCNENDMHWYHDTGHESVANAFAGELLLPTSLVKASCDVKRVDLKPIMRIAERFQTSLTATAIKFVRLCPEMCAVVLSENAKVKWAYRSEDFWPFIQRGTKLDARTLAFDFFRGTPLPQESQEVEADAWFEVKRGDAVQEVVEHSIAIPSINSVLTILWIEP
jgi:Zn-dependent peptidase ImmA (M78 family)